MYETILFPTDGGPTTEDALEHALSLSKTYVARLYALHVVDTDALPLDAHARELLEQLETDARRSLAEIEEQATEYGVEHVRSEMRVGTPHEEILSFADDHDVDLIVMGTHGRGGVRRLLLGSVTERVLRLADVPVLTVGRGAAETS